MQGKGKTKESFSIDRINNDEGYHIGNIRILTLSNNSRKGNKILHYDWQTKEAFVVNTRLPEIIPDETCPF